MWVAKSGFSLSIGKIEFSPVDYTTCLPIKVKNTCSSIISKRRRKRKLDYEQYTDLCEYVLRIKTTFPSIISIYLSTVLQATNDKNSVYLYFT